MPAEASADLCPWGLLGIRIAAGQATPPLVVAIASKPAATRTRALIASHACGSNCFPPKRLLTDGDIDLARRTSDVKFTGPRSFPRSASGGLRQRAHGILSQIPETFPFKPWLNRLLSLGSERL
jgi:hypothetical protein